MGFGDIQKLSTNWLQQLEWLGIYVNTSASIRGLLFDLEGVLVRGKSYKRLPGARKILDFCACGRIPYSIVTNNTTETPESLLKILQGIELPVESSCLLTPLDVLSLDLSRINSAIVFGTDNLATFVSSHDVDLAEHENVDAVICGSNFKINSELLSAATRAILEHEAAFLCLHKNRLLLDSNGLRQPSAGCLVVGLEYSTNTKARVLGKPSREFFQRATDGWNIDPAEILLISDDPFSDLLGGQEIGYLTAFISTGKYDSGIKRELDSNPDYCWDNLNEALEFIERNIDNATV